MAPAQEQPRLLNRLCKMCYNRRSLPGTMVIPENALILSPQEPLVQFQGGSATVSKGGYRGRAVAIKVMQLYASSDLDKYLSVGIPIRKLWTDSDTPNRPQRFCREAVIWRHLRHPNVLPLLGATLEIQDSKFRYALVSEWMDNGDINGFIKRHGDVNRAQLVSRHALACRDRYDLFP